MSVKFNHTKHKELWNWLADNPGSLKQEWPGWNGKLVENCCFACVYDEEKMAEEGCSECCKHCPLEWPGNLVCGEDNNLYSEWVDTIKDDGSIARKIANIPVKFGVETI